MSGAAHDLSSERFAWRASARAVGLVAARELGAAIDTKIATLAAIAYALLANALFMNEFFLAGVVDLEPFFVAQPLLLAFLLPALSMRLWAEERKSRTVELLFTLPLRPLEAVLGKFLAALALFALFLACTLPLVLMLEVLGSPDRGAIVSGYLGLFLFGGLLLALGGLASALARDQIVAFVASVLVGVVLVVTGEERVASVLDGLAPTLDAGTFLREHLSALVPYEEFVRGVVRLSGLLYFGLFAGLALWGTALVLERDRA